MTPSDTDAGRRSRESTTNGGSWRGSRRTFLKTAAAGGAIAGGVGLGLVGTAAAGIPTPWLHRDGNLIRDPNGNKVILRGLNVPDVKRMNVKDFRPNADETIQRTTNEDDGWYTRIVRLPVQPTDIGGHDAGGIPPVPGFDQGQLDSYLETHLRPAVDFCAQRGVYCIVDYHRHRGEDDEHAYDSQGIHDELTMFWETVAPEFANDSHVLYEVYNEPIHPFQGHYDPNTDVDPTDDVAIETWNTWKDAAQPWVDTIRANAPQNLILIGSPRWTQWTYQAPNNEFEGDNLAYTGHVYAHANLRPLSTYFGEPAEQVPVFMTEFGWGQDGADWLTGTAEKEGAEFTTFFENYDVHWTVWCFDSKWSPAMLHHDWSLNAFGQFWKDVLAEKKSADLPTGEDGTWTPPDSTATDGTGPSATTTPAGTVTDACPDGTAAPAQVGDAYPQDLNGDGLHRDVNGNCRLDNDDVVSYFEEMNSAGISENVASYDYNGNGRIDFDDLVTLFESL